MLIRKFNIHDGEAFEHMCSKVCFIAGALFLVMALLGSWYHLFTMSACIAAGLLIDEDTHH